MRFDARLHLLLSALFLGAIFTPLAVMSVRGPETVTSENRTLAPRPVRPEKLRDLPEAIRQTDAYLTDRFGLRGQMIRVYARLKLALGVSGARRALIGREGWLFLNDDPYFDTYLGTDPELEQKAAAWVDLMESRRRTLAAKGIRYYILIGPDKHSIYPEYLPAGIPPKQRENFTDRVTALAAERAPKLVIIDPRAAFLDAKASSALYTRTDTHWTPEAIFIAYRQLAAAIRKDFPRFAVPERRQFTLTDIPVCKSGYTDLINVLAQPCTIEDTYIGMTPKARYQAQPDEYLSPPPHSAHSTRKTVTDQKGRPRIFIIRDSYTYLMEPFLKPDFSVIVSINHVTEGTFPLPVIERHRPDIVLLEMVERDLANALKR